MTAPEIKSDMPEAEQDIRNEQKDDAEEDYIEDDADQGLRDSIKFD